MQFQSVALLKCHSASCLVGSYVGSCLISSKDILLVLLRLLALPTIKNGQLTSVEVSTTRMQMEEAVSASTLISLSSHITCRYGMGTNVS